MSVHEPYPPRTAPSVVGMSPGPVIHCSATQCKLWEAKHERAQHGRRMASTLYGLSVPICFLSAVFRGNHRESCTDASTAAPITASTIHHACARACHAMRRRRDKVREWTFPDGVARSEGVGELRLVTSGPHPPKPASGVAGMSQRRDPSDSGRWIGTVAECHSCETQSETAQVVAVTRTPPAPT